MWDGPPKERVRFVPGALGALLASFLGTSLAAPGTDAGWRQRVEAGALQARIDEVLPGGSLILEAGVHEGPITIGTPHVHLEGRPGAIIDGRGLGSVVIVAAPGVSLEGLTVRNSGSSNTQVDAGVRVQGQRGIALRSLMIEDTLFGIDIGDSRDLLVEDCDLVSRPAEVTMRGDALRIWASEDVMIRGNRWRESRDAVAWYSKRVTFEDNVGVRSRYSIHSMYSEHLTIRGNRFEDNSVGIFLMYGDGFAVLNNEILRSSGAAGIGLGLKETSNVYAEGNVIASCASGIVVDNSPWSPRSKNWFHRNLISFNGRGIVLANDRSGNQFVGNVIRSNTESVDTEDRKTSASLWQKNYWDVYQGFDRNGDGLGDTPHTPRKFGDIITGQSPATQFFEGTPVLAIIGLVERLVPITEPLLVLTDPAPLMRAPEGAYGRERAQEKDR